MRFFTQKSAFLLLLLFGSLHLLIPFLNHYFFRTYAFDYSAYNFAFFDYAHGRVSACPIYLFPYDVTFLQDHFSLTLMLFAPLYWTFGQIFGTYTLLLVQSVCIFGGGWATYKLIKHKANDEIVAFFALLYYFLLLGRYTAYVGDCNLAVIGSAIIPVFLYLFEKGKTVPLFICFFFLIFNREDYALWLVFIMAFLAIVYRKDSVKLKLSITLLLLSILLFCIIFMWIIPSFEDENKKYTLFNFSVLGKNPFEAVRFMAEHPIRTFELLFINHSGNSYYDGVKGDFYDIYFLCGGVLLLVRPAYLLAFLPLLAKKMYNDEPIRWSFESFYSIEVVSILPVFVFMVIADFKKSKVRLTFSIIMCYLAGTMCLKKLTLPDENHRALLGDSKKYNFLSQNFYSSEFNISEVNNAIAMIPDDASVSASGRLSTHLSFRKKIYYFPKVADVEYIALLKTSDNWPMTKEEFNQKLEELLNNKEWRIVSDKKDIIIFARK